MALRHLRFLIYSVYFDLDLYLLLCRLIGGLWLEHPRAPYGRSRSSGRTLRCAAGLPI